MEHVQVLIIGGGMAGLSAAIWCQRLGLSAVVLEGTDAIGGQIGQIRNRIWDFPPGVYQDGEALLTELQKNESLRASGLVRTNEQALSIDTAKRLVHTTARVYRPDYLIMATGIRPNELPALAKAPNVLGPWFSTTSNAKSLANQNILVIGGGDRAVESAINLSSYAQNVWVSVRSNRLRARDEWQKQLCLRKNVTILWETEIAAVTADPAPVATLHSTVGKPDLTLAADWILPRIGVRGNSELLPELPTYGEGFYVVNDVLQTQIDWIYAIGDVINGPAYASLALASGQAMKAIKHIILTRKENSHDAPLS
ncbi:NAD(P)/FAD-dependent oxidoreductase [Brevibacillus fluminis]|uniref:NAD(P)/FAD-dependent oxidoreductase n=1 Tax=Brevibacillus fluminis TaxID=511487 RepID=UPI003F8C7618